MDLDETSSSRHRYQCQLSPPLLFCQPLIINTYLPLSFFTLVMIILFLKYYSVHIHARKMKEAAAAEAAASEPKKDVSVQTEPSLSGALVTESLG